ncbi:MAG: hypothetical protein IJ509_01075 [Bacilli bacterium]|nr:hypothetical protein [Bacilli bacterium]
MTKRIWIISLDERITKLNEVIRRWINYFIIADMKGYMVKKVSRKGYWNTSLFISIYYK